MKLLKFLLSFKKRVYVDCDPGVDDFAALIYLFNQPCMDIVGIGSVTGNAKLDVVNKNLELFVGLVESNVKLYRGAREAIVEEFFDSSDYHGVDGLTGFWECDIYKKNLETIEKMMGKVNKQDISASMGIIELSKKYNGELVILALGPLTNLAIAHLIDNELGSRLKEIVLLGGHITGSGNSTSYLESEFNFSIDPEAAYIVLNRLQCDKLVVPINVSGSPRVNSSMVSGWCQSRPLLAEILSFCLRRQEQRGKSLLMYDLYSAMLLAAGSRRADIASWEERAATVELTGRHSRGRVITDRHDFIGQNQFQLADFSRHFRRVRFVTSFREEEMLEVIKRG